MRKIVFAYLTALFILLASVYLVFAYTYWTFNPSLFPLYARLIHGVMSAGIFVYIIARLINVTVKPIKER